MKLSISSVSVSFLLLLFCFYGEYAKCNESVPISLDDYAYDESTYPAETASEEEPVLSDGRPPQVLTEETEEQNNGEEITSNEIPPAGTTTETTLETTVEEPQPEIADEEGKRWRDIITITLNKVMDSIKSDVPENDSVNKDAAAVTETRNEEETPVWKKMKLFDVETLRTFGNNMKEVGENAFQKMKNLATETAAEVQQNLVPLSGGLLYASLLAAGFAKSTPMGVAAVFSPLLLLGAGRLSVMVAIISTILLGLVSTGAYAAAKLMLRFMSKAGGVLGKVAKQLEPTLRFIYLQGEKQYVKTWGKEEETMEGSQNPEEEIPEGSETPAKVVQEIEECTDGTNSQTDDSPQVVAVDSNERS